MIGASFAPLAGGAAWNAGTRVSSCCELAHGAATVNVSSSDNPSNNQRLIIAVLRRYCNPNSRQDARRGRRPPAVLPVKLRNVRSWLAYETGTASLQDLACIDLCDWSLVRNVRANRSLASHARAHYFGTLAARSTEQQAEFSRRRRHFGSKRLPGRGKAHSPLGECVHADADFVSGQEPFGNRCCRFPRRRVSHSCNRSRGH